MTSLSWRSGGRPRLVYWASLAVALATLCPAVAHAGRNCTAAEKKNGDKWLWLNAQDQALSIRTHLPWGEPRELQPTSGERLLLQRGYVNRYDADLRIPLWSAEQIRFSKIGKVEGRVNCFRADPRLTTDHASLPSDYSEPIFDQGHMSPDADQDSSVRSVVNTYVMSNMTPQNCQFNRGIWQILEGLTRRWAKQFKTVYVLSGSVFDRNGDGQRDVDEEAKRMASNTHKARVAIPSAFYKIIARRGDDGQVKTLTILMPHTRANPIGDAAVAYLEGHLSTIAVIEQLTGYDLFPDANEPVEALTLWTFVGAPPGSLCPLADQPDVAD